MDARETVLYSDRPSSEEQEIQTFNRLVTIGFIQACRVGVPSAERQDCARYFALHLFHKTLSDNLIENEPYLFRAAHNFACNYRRNLPVYLCIDAIPEDCLQSDSGVEFHRIELRCLFERLLSLLTPKQMEVVRRYYYEGESIQQIALSLQITVGGVKMHLHRAKATLKKAIVAEYILK